MQCRWQEEEGTDAVVEGTRVRFGTRWIVASVVEI